MALQLRAPSFRESEPVLLKRVGNLEKRALHASAVDDGVWPRLVEDVVNVISADTMSMTEATDREGRSKLPGVGKAGKRGIGILHGLLSRNSSVADSISSYVARRGWLSVIGNATEAMGAAEDVDGARTGADLGTRIAALSLSTRDAQLVRNQLDSCVHRAEDAVAKRREVRRRQEENPPSPLVVPSRRLSASQAPGMGPVSVIPRPRVPQRRETRPQPPASPATETSAYSDFEDGYEDDFEGEEAGGEDILRGGGLGGFGEQKMEEYGEDGDEDYEEDEYSEDSEFEEDEDTLRGDVLRGGGKSERGDVLRGGGNRDRDRGGEDGSTFQSWAGDVFAATLEAEGLAAEARYEARKSGAVPSKGAGALSLWLGSEADELNAEEEMERRKEEIRLDAFPEVQEWDKYDQDLRRKRQKQRDAKLLRTQERSRPVSRPTRPQSAFPNKKSKKKRSRISKAAKRSTSKPALPVLDSEQTRVGVWMTQDWRGFEQRLGPPPHVNDQLRLSIGDMQLITDRWIKRGLERGKQSLGGLVLQPPNMEEEDFSRKHSILREGTTDSSSATTKKHTTLREGTTDSSSAKQHSTFEELDATMERLALRFGIDREAIQRDVEDDLRKFAKILKVVEEEDDDGDEVGLDGFGLQEWYFWKREEKTEGNNGFLGETVVGEEWTEMILGLAGLDEFQKELWRGTAPCDPLEMEETKEAEKTLLQSLQLGSGGDFLAGSAIQSPSLASPPAELDSVPPSRVGITPSLMAMVDDAVRLLHTDQLTDSDSESNPFFKKSPNKPNKRRPRSSPSPSSLHSSKKSHSHLPKLASSTTTTKQHQQRRHLPSSTSTTFVGPSPYASRQSLPPVHPHQKPTSSSPSKSTRKSSKTPSSKPPRPKSALSPSHPLAPKRSHPLKKKKRPTQKLPPAPPNHTSQASTSSSSSLPITHDSFTQHLRSLRTRIQSETSSTLSTPRVSVPPPKPRTLPPLENVGTDDAKDKGNHQKTGNFVAEDDKEEGIHQNTEYFVAEDDKEEDHNHQKTEYFVAEDDKEEDHNHQNTEDVVDEDEHLQTTAQTIDLPSQKAAEPVKEGGMLAVDDEDDDSSSYTTEEEQDTTAPSPVKQRALDSPKEAPLPDMDDGDFSDEF